MSGLKAQGTLLPIVDICARGALLSSKIGQPIVARCSRPGHSVRAAVAVSTTHKATDSSATAHEKLNSHPNSKSHGQQQEFHGQRHRQLHRLNSGTAAQPAGQLGEWQEQQHVQHAQQLEQQLLLQLQPSVLQQFHQQHANLLSAAPAYDAAAAALTGQLKRAATWQEVVQLVQQYRYGTAAHHDEQQQPQQGCTHAIAGLNPQLLSCMLTALGKLQPAAPQQTAAVAGRHSRHSAHKQHQQDQLQFAHVIQLLFQQVLEQLPSMRPREVSNLIWAASQLHQPPSAVHLKQLVAHMAQPAVATHANAQDISMCLYAAAVLGLQLPQQHVAALLNAASAQLEAASPQSVSNIMWAVATMQYRPHEEWLQSVERRCCCILQQQAGSFEQPYCSSSSRGNSEAAAAGFTSKGLHQLLWSMAKLQWVPEQQFLTVFWDVIAVQLQNMAPQGTTGLLWAAASIGVQPPQHCMQSWFQVTHRQLTQGRFGDQDVSNALWGLVGLGLTPSASWVAAALGASEGILSSAGSQELAVMLWGWAKMGVRPSQHWMQTWLAAMTQHMSSYCAPALASSAYALAVLRFKPPRQWCEMLLAGMQRQMAAFGAQELSNIVWAFAVLGLRPNNTWLTDFQLQALNESGSFNAQELSLICWSLAKLQHRPPVEWVASLLSHGLELQGGLAAQSVVMLMTALVKWDMPEMKEGGKYRMLLPRYWAASQQLLPTCSVYQLSVLWWARARLGCAPNTACSTNFWRAVTTALTASLGATSAGTAHLQVNSCSNTAAVLPATSQSHQQQLMGPAAVVRCVWATGKMDRTVPGVPAGLLLQAAGLIMPQCSFAGLTALGMGIVRMRRTALRRLAASQAAAAAEGRGQPAAAIGHTDILAAVNQRSDLWEAWFERGTQLLQQDAAGHSQVQMQQQYVCARQVKQPMEPHQAVMARQSSIRTADVVMQMFTAGQLGLTPTSSWAEAMLAAVTVRVSAMSLEQLSWVLWSVVQLGLGDMLLAGWLNTVLDRVQTCRLDQSRQCGSSSRHADNQQSCIMRIRKALMKLQ